MSIKAVFKSIVFILLLFVVLYVGMNNTERIKFSFPVAFKDKIEAQAGWIYFGIFAIGVLAGTLLHGGGKGSAPKPK